MKNIHIQNRTGASNWIEYVFCYKYQRRTFTYSQLFIHNCRHAVIIQAIPHGEFSGKVG